MFQLQKELTSKKTAHISFEKQEEQYWADAQLSVKQLFFNFLLCTVGNFTPYRKPIDVDPESPNYKRLTSSDFFDFDAYLKMQKDKSMQDKDSNYEFVQ